MTNVIIFGAEGLAKDTYKVILENGEKENVLGFIDEINYDRELFGLLVKNNIDKFAEYGKHSIVIAIGNPKYKKGVVSRLKDCIYINIIHRNTHINKFINVGTGNIIMGNTTLSYNVEIGDHICIYSQTIVSHDCKIGSYCTIAPGVTICGNVSIGQGCFIGAGTVIKEKVDIADDVFIGAGSLVLRSIHKSGMYYGSPVKMKGVEARQNIPE